MTGIELFIKTLQHWGVPFISTLCGNGLNPLDEACHNNGLRLRLEILAARQKPFGGDFIGFSG